jgi:DNA-directed RNA polymerase specialized sigma24 family protein
VGDTVRSKWSLSREAFDRLLAALDSDRSAAGEEYERLRRKLVHYFGWQQLRDPEALADEVLNRIARKIEEGAQIEDYRQYAFGISRLLLLENRRAGIRERVALETNRSLPSSSGEHPAICLERCLELLSPENRDLILAYYQGEKRGRIEARIALAERLGIDLNALRNRALRLRLKLEQCMARCIESDESNKSATYIRERI